MPQSVDCLLWSLVNFGTPLGWYCFVMSLAPMCVAAGFAYKGNVFGADEAAQTINVNYRGTRAVCEAVQPLLTQNARIVNVSSRSGLYRILQSNALRQQVESAKTPQAVDELADDFINAIKTDKYGFLFVQLLLQLAFQDHA